MPTPTREKPTIRTVALTAKGRLTVQLLKLEAALDRLSEAEQRDLLDELEPIVRVVRSRASIAAERSPLDDRIAV